MWLWDDDTQKRDNFTRGPFCLFCEKKDEFFAVSGVAHKPDFVRERTQTLRGELPLLKIYKGGDEEEPEHKFISRHIGHGTLYWLQGFWDLMDSVGTVPISLHPQEDEVVEMAEFDNAFSVRNGKHPFTDMGYPVCSYWKH